MDKACGLRKGEKKYIQGFGGETRRKEASWKIEAQTGG